MPNPIVPVVILLLAAPPPTDKDQGNRGVLVAQLTIRQRIIIRVPRPPVGPPPMADIVIPDSPRRMAEKNGPKCIPVQNLAGSAEARKDSVDLMMADGSRMRAKLDHDCPALDFYAGFYIKKTPDGMICAERDIIRSRSGRACPISSFKRLQSKRGRD
ncbi:hypothetical protein [Sphingomonas sp.]|jgi:hypothetical protein|uniref:hypothetical protein n=1 Tax=Sphingomonas sp. TaxID=28214 RepID=UPI003D6D91D3